MLLQLQIRTQAPSCETQSSTNHDPRTPSLSPSARHPLEHHRGPVQLAPAKRCGSHRGRSPEEQASTEHLWIFVAAGNAGNLLWSALGVNSGYMEKDYSQRFLLMTARSPFSTCCSRNRQKSAELQHHQSTKELKFFLHHTIGSCHIQVGPTGRGRFGKLWF